jgi:hypothetical protein
LEQVLLREVLVLAVVVNAQHVDVEPLVVVVVVAEEEEKKLVQVLALVVVLVLIEKQ